MAIDYDALDLDELDRADASDPFSDYDSSDTFVAPDAGKAAAANQAASEYWEEKSAGDTSDDDSGGYYEETPSSQTNESSSDSTGSEPAPEDPIKYKSESVQDRDNEENPDSYQSSETVNDLNQDATKTDIDWTKPDPESFAGQNKQEEDEAADWKKQLEEYTKQKAGENYDYGSEDFRKYKTETNEDHVDNDRRWYNTYTDFITDIDPRIESEFDFLDGVLTDNGDGSLSVGDYTDPEERRDNILDIGYARYDLEKVLAETDFDSIYDLEIPNIAKDNYEAYKEEYDKAGMTVDDLIKIFSDSNHPEYGERKEAWINATQAELQDELKAVTWLWDTAVWYDKACSPYDFVSKDPVESDFSAERERVGKNYAEAEQAYQDALAEQARINQNLIDSGADPNADIDLANAKKKVAEAEAARDKAKAESDELEGKYKEAIDAVDAKNADIEMQRKYMHNSTLADWEKSKADLEALLAGNATTDMAAQFGVSAEDISLYNAYTAYTEAEEALNSANKNNQPGNPKAVSAEEYEALQQQKSAAEEALKAAAGEGVDLDKAKAAAEEAKKRMAPLEAEREFINDKYYGLLLQGMTEEEKNNLWVDLNRKSEGYGAFYGGGNINMYDRIAEIAAGADFEKYLLDPNADADDIVDDVATAFESYFVMTKDGKHVLVPAMIKNEDGDWEHADRAEAIRYYRKTGENFGTYDTVEEAQAAQDKLVNGENTKLLLYRYWAEQATKYQKEAAAASERRMMDNSDGNREAEAYWQKLYNYAQSKATEYTPEDKQAIIAFGKEQSKLTKQEQEIKKYLDGDRANTKKAQILAEKLAVLKMSIGEEGLESAIAIAKADLGPTTNDYNKAYQKWINGVGEDTLTRAYSASRMSVSVDFETWCHQQFEKNNVEYTPGLQMQMDSAEKTYEGIKAEYDNAYEAFKSDAFNTYAEGVQNGETGRPKSEKELQAEFEQQNPELTAQYNEAKAIYEDAKQKADDARETVDTLKEFRGIAVDTGERPSTKRVNDLTEDEHYNDYVNAGLGFTNDVIELYKKLSNTPQFVQFFTSAPDSFANFSGSASEMGRTDALRKEIMDGMDALGMTDADKAEMNHALDKYDEPWVVLPNDNWSYQEICTFAYYMGSGDIDTALEYAHDQNVKYAGESREARTQKLQEFSKQMTEKLNQDGFGNKAVGTAWTAGVVAANAVNSALLVPAAEAVDKLLTIAQTGEMPITYGVGVTESGRSLIGGAAEALDENDWAMRIAGTEFTLGEVYQSVSSMIESMSMGKVGAIIGTSFGASAGAAEKIASAYMNLAFGSSAFLDAVDEAYEQTGDIGKSLIIAGGAAFCEAFFEKASLEILFNKIMPDISNFATLALNTGVFSLVEGSEEVFTDLGNLVVETLAAGDMSKYKQLYNDLTDPKGPYQLSAEEAERIVKGQIKDQLVVSGLSGMLSAGPTVALHGAKEWVHQSKTGGRVLSNDLVGPMVTSIKEALNTPEAFSYDELSGNTEPTKVETPAGPQTGTKEQEQAVEDMWDRGEKAQPPADTPAETPAAQPGTPEQVEAVEDMWDRGEKAQPPRTAEEQAAEDEVNSILEGKASPSRRDAEKIAKTPTLKKAFERMYNVTLKGYVSGMVDTIRTAYAEQQQKQAAAEQAAGKYDADGRARTEAEQTAQTEAARAKYDADGRARTEAEQTAQTEAARNKYEADGRNRTDAETKKAQQELLEEAEALDNEIKSRMQAQSEKAIALQAEIDGLNQKLEAGTITSAEQKRLNSLLKQQEKNVAAMKDLSMKAGQLLNKFRETLPEAFKNFILTNAEKYANVNQGELARAAMEAKAGAINAQSDLAAYYAQIDNPDAVVLEEVGATLQAEFGLTAKEAHDVQGAVSAIVHGATGVYGIGVTGIRSFANSEAMKSPKVRQAVVSYVNSLIKDGVIHLAKPNNEQRNISTSSGTTSTPHVIPGAGRTSPSTKKAPTTTNGFINSIKTALTGMPEHFKTLINRMTGTTVQEAVEENKPGDKIPERVKPAEVEEISSSDDIADVLTQVWAYVALENEIRRKSGQRSDTLADTIKGRKEGPTTVNPNPPQKSVIPAAMPTFAQNLASTPADNIYERAKRLPIPPKADTSMPGRKQDNQHAAQPMAQSPTGSSAPVNTEERTAVFASSLTQDIKDLLDKQIKIGKKPYNFFSYYNMRKKDAPAITRELAAEEFRLILAGNDFNKVVDYVAKKYKTDTNRTGSQPDTKTKATKENSADVTHPRNNEDWYQTSPESPKVTRAQFIEDETKNGKSPAEANEEFDRIMHSIEQDKAFPGEVHYAETKEATPKEQAKAAVRKKPKLLARLNMTLDDLQKRVDNKRTALIELEKQYDDLRKNDKATPEQRQALWSEVSRATVDLAKDISDLNVLRNRKGLPAVETRTIDQRIKDQQKIVDQASQALHEYTASFVKNKLPVDTAAIRRLFNAMQAEVDKLNELKREKENEEKRNKNNGKGSDTGVNESDTRNAEELSANDGRGQEGTTEKSEGTRSVVLNFPDRSIQITNGTIVWDSSSATNESALTSTEREFVNKVSQGNADRVILVDAETLEFIFPGGKHELNGYFTITSNGQRIVVANVNEDLRHGYHENKHSLLSALDEANRRAYLSKAFESIFGKDQEAYENLLSFYTQLYRPAFSSKFKLTAAEQKALTDYVMEEIYADLSVGYDRMLASVGASVFENADITPYMERAQAFEEQYRLQDYANDHEDFYTHNEDGTRSSEKRGILPAEMMDGKAAYDIESRQTQGYTRAQRYIANKISQGRAGGEVQGKASLAKVTIPTPIDVQPEIFNITGDPHLEDRFSQATEKTPLPKQDIALTASGSVTKTTRITDNGELYLATVRDLRNQAFRENEEFMAKYGEKGILEFNKLLDVVGDYLQEAGETFHYLDLADINSATLSIDPMTNEINLSSMVSNGDYEVNFDFGTICERRQALQSLVDNLLLNATYDKNGRASVQLNATTLHQINEMLAKEGINTACLICFVETKRYGQQNQFGEFTTMWNKEVRKALKELGMEAQFFDFKHGVSEMSKEHQINRRKAVEAKNAATKEANLQKKERGEKAGETTKEAVERMVKAIAENSPEDLKLLDTGDLQSMPGRTTLAQNFPELDSLVKKKGGSAAPKPVYGFSPYNGELESLRYTGDSGTLQDHIKEIAGVRSQSFSDFIITHVFDHMQKTGGMASRNLRGHTYTKVPARAELFGKTGEKINMSILFDIRPDINPWYAGLNAETQDLTVDLDHPRNRPYNFSDYRAKEQGDTNWVQSFPWDRAVALQNTPGFSKNVGTIGVALSYWHYKHLLADPEIRQVIGYHSSSYPKDIKDITHIDNATDYSAVQNILHFNGFVKPNYEIPAGTPSYASRPASVDAGDNTLVTAVDDNKYKDLKAVFRQRLKENPGKPRGKVAVALMQEILNYADENGYAFSTNKVKSEGAHGQFDLYGKNGGVEDTHDPRMTAENYIAYCLDKGYLPQFYEFSTDPNYYKQVFDFNMYDRITGEYAPQNPVSIYDENGESVFGSADELKKQLKAFMEEYNEQQRKTQSFINDPTFLEKVREITGDVSKMSLDVSEYDGVEEAAAEHFGTTGNYKVAGYLLQDGRMLDFSGAHWLGDVSQQEKDEWRRNNSRQVDHEDVFEAFEKNGNEFPSDSSLAFIQRGNIRMVPEIPGIEISALTEPTAKQYSRIRDYIRTINQDPNNYYQNYFTVDLRTNRNTRPQSLKYEGTINPNKIVNDIKAFYRTGEVPQQSVVSQFHDRFSLADTEMQDVETEEQIEQEAENEANYDRYSLWTGPEPVHTQYGFKLMSVDEKGLPHAMFIDAAAPYELGKWYLADSPKLENLWNLEPGYAYLVDKDDNVDMDTRRPVQRKAKGGFSGLPGKKLVDQATLEGKRWMVVDRYADGSVNIQNVGINGSETVSTFALRPGIHAVDIPSMGHIGAKSKGSKKIDTRRPNQRWFLIEYPVDVDYNQEAYAHKTKDIRDHLPERGWYSFQTNSGAEAKQHWFITGGMKIVGAVSEDDIRRYAREHGFKEDLPWKMGKIYSDDTAIDLYEYIRTTTAAPTPSKQEMRDRIKAGQKTEQKAEKKPGKKAKKANSFGTAEDANGQFRIDFDSADTQTNRYSLSKTDQQYMDAVNGDDMGTAQAIVDKAAKKAGYKKHAYHGTLAYGFNEFRMISTRELGVHFGTEEAARVFYNNTYNRRGFGENPGIYDVYLKMENTLKTPDVWGDPEALDTIIQRVDGWIKNGYYEHRSGAEDVKWTKADSKKLRDALKINDDYYAYRDACDDWFEETRRLENPTEYIDPVTGKVYTYEETWDLADSEAAKLGLTKTYARDGEDGKKTFYATDSRRRKETLLFTLDAAYEGTAIQDRINEAAWRANQLAQTYLKNLGFDSIRYINEMEDIGSESYIILEPTHIKSAEPVTYDDNGNIIPPSQRFDGDIKDIRFSLLHDVVDTEGNVYDDVVRVTYPWTRDILSSAEEFDYYVQQMMPGKEITTLDENGEKQVITFANADDMVIKHNFEHPALSELSSGRKTGVRSWLVYLNAQELLDNSTFDHHEPQNSDWWNNHDWFDKNGWDYRTAYMMDKYNKIYPVTLYITNTSDGRKILYHAAVTTPLAKDVDIPATAKNNPNENFRRFNKFPKPEGYVDRVPAGKEEVDAVEERLSLKTDSEGNQLSEGQAEYFADSKVLDDDGNLLVMYHGTDSYGFTVFDPQYTDDKRSLFLTSDPDVARSYINGLNQDVRSAMEIDNGAPVKELPLEEKIDLFNLTSKKERILRSNTLQGYLDEQHRNITRYYLELYKDMDNLRNPPIRDFLKAVYAAFTEDGKYRRLSEEELNNLKEKASGAKAVMDSYSWRDKSCVDWIVGAFEQIEKVEDSSLPRSTTVYLRRSEDANGYFSFYFSTQEELEEELKGIESKQSGIYPVYVNVVNPLVIDAERHNWNDIPIPREIAEWRDKLTDEEARFYISYKGKNVANTRALSKYAKEHNYDGVIIKNLRDNGSAGYRGSGSGFSTVAVAFNSDQIKDIGNKNPTHNPDMRFSLSINEAFDEFGYDVQPEDTNPTDLTQSALSENLYYSDDGNTAYYQTPTGETVILNNVGTDSPEAQFINYLEANNNANSINTTTTEPYTIPAATRDEYDGYNLGEQDAGLRRGPQEIPSANQEGTLRRAGGTLQRNGQSGSQSASQESVDRFSFALGDDDGWAIYNDYGEDITYTDNYPYGSFYREIVDAIHNNTDIEDLKNYLEGMAQRVAPEDVDANLDMLKKIVDANPRMSDMERQNMYRTMEALQKKYGGFKVAKDDKKKNIPIPRKLDKDTKVMKFTKTVEANAETEWLTDETMKKVIEDAMMSYVPMSNDKAIKEAMRIWDRENGNFERLLRHLEDKLNMNDRITPVDVALGEYMLREAEANGRVNDAMRLVADLALMGHNTGQTLQAFRILKKLTPRGQLYYLNGVIKQLNERYKKDNPNIKIDEALVRKLLASQTRKELDTTMDEIKKNIADQLPVHWWDRWNAWRYVAMLGNPRTHVRNAFGNGMFVPAVLLKDFIAAELENRTNWIDPNLRTKTLPSEYKNSAVFRKFALEQTEVMKDILSGKASGNKFTDVNEIIGMRDLWGSTPLGKAIKAWDETNSKALEAEDYFFLSRYFQRALMQFLQARGVTEQDLMNGFGGDRDSRKLLNEARAWAVLEAQRNTYRDANAAATQLNRLKRAGLVPYTLLEGAVPFTKTPLNILARGVEYSPIGLIKSMIMLGRDLRSGEYTTSEVLDRLAAGASGTALTILGALFASIGWLRGSGPSDDELAEFEELQGHQNWAVEIGGRSYTIDWMAPAALPLFIGVNIMNMLQGDINIESAWDIGTAFARLAEPLSSLSMLDGINNLLTTMSTADKTERYSTLAWALLTSYISQGVPTILGQAARSMDPDQRRTYIDQNKATPDALQRFIQSSLQAKIPLWEMQRMAYVDAWGRTDSAETTGDWIWKVFENFLSPGYGNTINTTPVDEELQRLFEATGDNTIFPDMLAKKYNVNGEEKNLTAAEYEQLMRTSGATAYNIAYEVIMSPEYAQLDDTGKMKLLDQAFEYAKNYGKTIVTPEYEMSASWMDTAQKVGASDYIRMRSLLPQTYSNDQLFAYLAVNPNLSNDQIADIVADEFSAPRQIYSTEFTGYVYDITDEDKDAMQVVFRDNLYTELRKMFDSVEYNRADPRERGYLIDDAYTRAQEKTKQDYGTILDSEGRVKDLGRASAVGKEKWGVAISATEKTTAEQAKYLSDSYAPDHKIDNPDRLGYVFNLNESQYRDLKDEFAKEWEKDYDALLNSNAYLNAETDEDRENMVAAQFNKTSKAVEEAFARGLKDASSSIRPASDFANPDDRYGTVEYNEDEEEVDEELSDVKAGWKWTDVYKIASENFDSVEEMAEWMAGKMTGATSIDNPDRIGHKMVLDESQKATEARHEQETFKKAAVKLMNDPSWAGLTDDEKAGALHDLEVAVAALEEGNYARYLIDNGYDYEDKRDVSSSTNQTFFTMLMTDDLTKDEVFDLLDQRYTSKVGTSIKGNSLSYVERAHRVDAYMEYIAANYDAFTAKYLTSDDEATLLKAATAFEKSLHKSGMSQSGNITARDFGITTKVSADQNRENKKNPNWTFERWMTNPIDFTSASTPYTSTGTTTTSSTTRPVIPPKNSANTGRTYHWSSANRKIP